MWTNLSWIGLTCAVVCDFPQFSSFVSSVHRPWAGQKHTHTHMSEKKNRPESVSCVSVLFIQRVWRETHDRWGAFAHAGEILRPVLFCNTSGHDPALNPSMPRWIRYLAFQKTSRPFDLLKHNLRGLWIVELTLYTRPKCMSIYNIRQLGIGNTHFRHVYSNCVRNQEVNIIYQVISFKTWLRNCMCKEEVIIIEHWDFCVETLI